MSEIIFLVEPDPEGGYTAQALGHSIFTEADTWDARRVLVQRYLDNVVAADRKMIAKVFHVLKWTSRELDRTIAALLEEGAIQEVQVEGAKQLQLVPTAFLNCTG